MKYVYKEDNNIIIDLRRVKFDATEKANKLKTDGIDAVSRKAGGFIHGLGSAMQLIALPCEMASAILEVVGTRMAKTGHGMVTKK